MAYCTGQNDLLDTHDYLGLKIFRHYMLYARLTGKSKTM